jgi:flagellin
MAVNSQRQLGMNNSQVSKALEKLSSGYRINRAGDDASGLAISEKMKSQIKGLDTASLNAQDGISLVQTAEGALTEVHNMLNRMTELATRSANGINEDLNRESLQLEVDKLQEEIDRISQSTNFNGIKLLDGSLGGGNVSANGTTFTGASDVSKFSSAEVTGAASDVSFTAVTSASATETFVIDGQKLEIDWSKGDAKKFLESITSVSGSTTAIATEAGKEWANKLTELFNNQIQEQGLKGSVKVTFDGTNFTLKSENKGSDSEFSFSGSTLTEAEKSLGSLLFGGSTTAGAPITSIISKAQNEYNGDTIAQNSTFQMNINGTKVVVTVTGQITKTSSATTVTMDTVATALQGYIQTAVDEYNKQNGLTAGTFDKASGLTGLTKADFTVEAADDGGFLIKYNGDVEDVKFSFSDIGDKDIASALGLANGSSMAGGNRGLILQIGDTADTFNQIAVSVANMSSLGIGVADVDISKREGAASAIDTIRSAIDKVSEQRAVLGATQNRLEYTINNLDTASENLQSANSRIRDTDMAKMMMEYTKVNVLTQSAQAMLAQANQQPQSVLQLLQ